MFDYYKKYHSTHDFINVQTISLDLSGSNSTPSILFHSPNINFPFSIGTVSDELKNILLIWECPLILSSAGASSLNEIKS